MERAARAAPPASPAAAGREPPGPHGWPLLGVLPRIWHDPLGFFTAVAAAHGAVTKFGTRKFTLYLLSGAEAIEHVLVRRAANYWKGEGLAAARTVMGHGLLTSHGDAWRRQRRLIQPAFAPAALAGLVPLLQDAVATTFRRWRTAANGTRRDVLPDLSALVQEVLLRGLFQSDYHALDARGLGRAMVVADDFVHRSAWMPLPLPGWVPTPARVRFRRALAFLDRTVLGLIEARRERASAGDGDGGDLLGRLLAARDPETGAAMAVRQVRDELVTLFMAGHDTTAAGLAWGLHLLAGAPEVRERVAAEVERTAPGRPLGTGDLPQLAYTSRVVDEVLRLYPPGWLLVRTPFAPDEICGHHVPAGAPLLISQWVVHRSPAYWEEPARFDPDRFLPERVAQRPRFAWFPYGGGARTCVGQHLADLVLRLVLGEAARAFEMVPERPAPVPRARTTLQPRPGVFLRLVPQREGVGG